MKKLLLLSRDVVLLGEEGILNLKRSASGERGAAIGITFAFAKNAGSRLDTSIGGATLFRGVGLRGEIFAGACLGGGVGGPGDGIGMVRRAGVGVGGGEGVEYLTSSNSRMPMADVR